MLQECWSAKIMSQVGWKKEREKKETTYCPIKQSYEYCRRRRKRRKRSYTQLPHRTIFKTSGGVHKIATVRILCMLTTPPLPSLSVLWAFYESGGIVSIGVVHWCYISCLVVSEFLAKPLNFIKCPRLGGFMMAFFQEQVLFHVTAEIWFNTVDNGYKATVCLSKV